MNNEKNIYAYELNKFIGKDVIVKTIDGEEIVGNCRAIDYTHLNIILMTTNEKIIIKNVKYIKRNRSYAQPI